MSCFPLFRRPSRRAVFFAAALLAFAVLISPPAITPARADSPLTIAGQTTGRADSHAPIGVMGDHMHKSGEWMLSYRFMRMSMSGNRIGTRSVSPEHIVTNIADPNGPMPATLRVVPDKMTMDMHMVGGMYAPTDGVTLMAMLSYIRNDMDLITFRGMAGTGRLGTFKTQSQGFGDPRLGALIRLYEDSIHHIHVNAGLSLPVGSIDRKDDVLTPMNTRVTMTLPYPMQIGSGTFDLLPGLTYSGTSGRFAWGAQYAAVLRLGENKRRYRLGNRHALTAWAAFSARDWLSFSLRAAGRTQGRIKGRDARITAPVQTAGPNFQGGRRIDLGLGVNFIVPEGRLRGNRLAFEFLLPVHQDLNGPQMESDWTLIGGWQWAF